MRSTVLLSLVSLSSVCLLSSGYGCGSSNSNNSSDGGTGSETSSSSSGGGSGSSSGGTGDASGDTGGDGAVPCTAMPIGTKVLATKTQSVVGVTSDNQVIIYDPTASPTSLSAVPLAGGTAATIGPFDYQKDYIAIAGNIVVLAQGGSQSNPAGTLTLWTAANGAKKIGSATYTGTPGSGVLDVSSDGKYVLYTENATATTADIYVAGTDGSNPTKIVSTTSVGNTCVPILYFVGDDAVVSYCTSQPDASTANAATVAAISGAPNWQTTQTFANGDAANFVVGRAGASSNEVAFVTSAGLQVEAIGGTTPTVIDANGTPAAMFNNAATSIIYGDKTGNVWTSPVAAPAPAELVAGPVVQLLGISPDDKWLELAKTQAQMGGGTDLYLVSTTASGADGGNALTTLDSMTDAALYGDTFTADNSHALFFSGISNGIGNYMGLALPPSGMPTTITKTGWVGYATSAAKVVYSDNYNSMAGNFDGQADLHAVDLAGTAAPSNLVTSADADFFVTADKSKIVYSWHGCPGDAEGIYSIAAP